MLANRHCTCTRHSPLFLTNVNLALREWRDKALQNFNLSRFRSNSARSNTNPGTGTCNLMKVHLVPQGPPHDPNKMFCIHLPFSVDCISGQKVTFIELIPMFYFLENNVLLWQLHNLFEICTNKSLLLTLLFSVRYRKIIIYVLLNKYN